MLLIPPVSLVGELQFFWVDADNVVRDLNKISSPHVWVKVGSVGMGLPETEISDSKLPLGSGTLIHQLNIGSRELDLPIVVHEESIEDLLLSVEDIHGWFDTGDEAEKRPGYLKIIRPDDTVRKLKCFFKSGLEGDTEEGGPNWTIYVVTLYAPDPFPTADSDTVVERIFPTYSSFSILNTGRKEAFPVIRLDGPFTNFVVKNVTRTIEEATDILLAGTITLTVGQYLIIDSRPSETRPGYSVYDQSGVNRISTITPTSKFWSLKAGTNLIEVSFTSGATSATKVTITFLPRYRSLLR